LGHWGSSAAGLRKPSAITLPASWALYLFAGWAVFAAAGLARIGLGFCQLRRLRKSCAPLDLTALDPRLRETLAEFDCPRSVAICVSDQLPVPTAIGFRRPRVVMPAWTMQELSPLELNTILLHELAHLRRWDDCTNLVQKMVGALWFFHPAVWWIERRLTLEREMACDDLVLAKTDSPRAYAECLVALAEQSLLRRGLALAQAAVGRMRHISLRVAQILDERRPNATRRWRPAPVFGTAVSLACLMVFSAAPRLVSFGNQAAGSLVATTPITPVRGERETAGMGARVVPTNFVVKPKARPPVSVAAQTRAKPSPSDRAPAQAMRRPVNPPALVRASFAADASAPQTLLLITYTRNYDASGSLVWNLRLWQVIVIGPGKKRMEQGMIGRSI
jgi:hypothetical protein